MEHGVKSKPRNGALHRYLSVFLKLVICRQRSSRSSKSLLAKSLDNSPRLSKIKTMLAFSKVDLRAMIKNLANSLFESDPDPSAMLFYIDIPAPWG